MNEHGLSQNAAIIETLLQAKNLCKSLVGPNGAVQNSSAIQESHITAASSRVSLDLSATLSRTIYGSPNDHTDNSLESVPSGLKILRAAGFVKLPVAASVSKALFVPQRPYDHAVNLVARFCAPRRRAKVAWIFHAQSMFVPYPPGLESRGVDISNVLFVETSTPDRALKTICNEMFFESIIFDHKISSTTLQIVRKWLKPTASPLLAKADALVATRADRLAVLIE